MGKHVYTYNPVEGDLNIGIAPEPNLLGIYVGTIEPELKTYSQWLSSRTGYWSWIDISTEVAGGITATIMSANAVGSINPLDSYYARYITAVINPANAVGSITALVASVTVAGQVSAEVMYSNATGMINALVASYARYTAGVINPALSTGMINALVATITGGPLSGFTDNFTGTNNDPWNSTYWETNANATIQSNKGQGTAGTVVISKDVAFSGTFSAKITFACPTPALWSGLAYAQAFTIWNTTGGDSTHSALLAYVSAQDVSVDETEEIVYSYVFASYNASGTLDLFQNISGGSLTDTIEFRFSDENTFDVYKNGSSAYSNQNLSSSYLGSSVNIVVSISGATSSVDSVIVGSL